MIGLFSRKPLLMKFRKARFYPSSKPFSDKAISIMFNIYVYFLIAAYSP